MDALLTSLIELRVAAREIDLIGGQGVREATRRLGEAVSAKQWGLPGSTATIDDLDTTRDDVASAADAFHAAARQEIGLQR